jgi:hypothetical protein
MRIVQGLGAVLVVAATALALLAAPAAGHETTAPKCSAATVLSPRNEVRTEPVTDPVESRAFGAAAINIEGGTLKFAVLIVNPRRETFVAGHIHTGAAGANGNVLVPLFAGSSSAGLFFQADSIEIGAERAAAICGNLAGHYVNYHTTLDPQGAVRGQLG